MPRRETTVEIAADWVAAVDGGLTPEQQRELELWLAADPSHLFAYKRLAGQYKVMDRLSEFRPANEAIDPDLPLSGTGLPTRVAGPSPQKTHRIPANSEPTPSTPRPHSRIWLPFPLILTTAVALALVITYTQWWRPAHGAIAETAVTAVGDLRTLELPDGSIVTLNTDSAVDVAYSSAERRVRLTKGEVHFAVAKNKDRPFIVEVGSVSVRAVGTAFNIRLKPEQIEVVVTEGLVQVDDTVRGRSVLPNPEVFQSPEFEQPVLAAGERAIIPVPSLAVLSVVAPGSGVAPSIVSPVAPAEITQRLSWREQRLVFDPTPLQDVVAEFNRYNRRQLRVADEATGRMLVGGTFKADDTETLVRLLESSFGVMAERRDNVIILRRQ